LVALVRACSSTVGPGERRDRTAEGVGHREGRNLISFDGDECALMEVDGEASGFREEIEDPLQVNHMFRNSSNDNKDVICILTEGQGRSSTIG
jgi:hypothetical protein